MKKVLTALLQFVLVVSLAARAGAEDPWIIDPHTHFKGEAQIAYESKTKKRHPKDTLGKVVEPDDYRALARRLGIQATLVVEAADQDKPEFNDWVLAQAKASGVVCGYVARADLAAADFLTHHERYQKTGYLNGYRFRMGELAGYLDDETARKHLARLAADKMVIDLLIEHRHAKDAIRLAREFPDLKVVLNHCLRARMEGGRMSAAWRQAIKDCAKLPNIYCKISSIVNFSEAIAFGDPAPAELDYYRPVLDPCFDAFGADRVIFATNWGVCEHFGKVEDVVRLVREFLETKGDAAVRKGMRDNAIRVYGIPTENLR